MRSVRRALWRSNQNRDEEILIVSLPAAAYRSSAGNDFGGIDVLVHDHPKETAHHFFPRHFAVIDIPVRIGVELVVGGIIEVRVDVHLRALRYLYRGVVPKLPIEVVVGHTQDHLFPSVRILQRIGHVLPSDMHVGHHENQFSVHIKYGLRGWSLPITVIRWNAEAYWIRRRGCQ